MSRLLLYYGGFLRLIWECGASVRRFLNSGAALVPGMILHNVPEFHLVIASEDPAFLVKHQPPTAVVLAAIYYDTTNPSSAPSLMSFIITVHSRVPSLFHLPFISARSRLFYQFGGLLQCRCSSVYNVSSIILSSNELASNPMKLWSTSSFAKRRHIYFSFLVFFREAKI
jgi:hypothetical protein